jgi:hypothetical protein
MYVCMYVCMHVCMGCTNVPMTCRAPDGDASGGVVVGGAFRVTTGPSHVLTMPAVCMYVCVCYVCMYVCMYVKKTLK